MKTVYEKPEEIKVDDSYEHNSSGILGARKINYKGKEFVATHHNPKTGEFWIEELGIWV